MPSETLSDDEVAELQARPSTELGGYRRVLLRPRERDALCATVRALRSESEQLHTDVGEMAQRLMRSADRCGELIIDKETAESENTALREQLAHWQERTRERTTEVEQLQSELAQREQEWKAFENLGKRVEADLRAQLAQVTQERERLQMFVAKAASDGCLRGRTIHCVENEPNPADWCVSCQAKALGEAK